MSKADDFLHRHLDVSNFAALRASAAQAAARDHKLKSAADAAFTAEIGRIKDYAKAHPDDDFTRANTDLVSRGVPATSWTAVGNVSFTSAMWWAIGGGLAFPEDLPLAFLFGGKGFGWGAWATFTSIVGGQFLVDPQVIAGYPEFVLENSPIGWVKKGPCNFTMDGGGVIGGGLSMSFYRSTDNTHWGTVGGPFTGVGGVTVGGTLELVWQGFKV